MSAGGGAAREASKRNSAVLVYMLLIVGLQIFLLVVAVEGVLEGNPGLAFAAAVLTVLLFVCALVMRWFLRDLHDA